MPAQNLPNMVVECLQKHQKKRQKDKEGLSSREITDWIFENYHEWCLEKWRNSDKINSEKDLLTQIRAEISAIIPRLSPERYPKIKIIKISKNRYEYCLAESTDSEETDEVESDTESPTSEERDSVISEHDLYPILAKFLQSELKIHSKRIDESRSRRTRGGGSGSNKWLHPDLVSIEDLRTSWDPIIRECVVKYPDKKIKLWSFEVKTKISRSNVREAFFQAVSNSSWANFGYLVAGSKIKDTETIKELRMLASRHGIGVIELDVKDLSKSQIMIPAKERDEIDWDMANRLAKANGDFLDYIKRINEIYETKRIIPSDWMPV